MIEIQNMVKTYVNGEVETSVLKGVSFGIKNGEFVAIIGPSGSGKSTLMHILGALDTVTSGTYILDGKDVSMLTENELAKIRSEKIGFVFQSFNLLARATVFRNVLLPLIYTDMLPEEREGRVKKALFSAGVPEDRWQYRSNQISGGQMQRVAIARALVNNPAMILADEPTGNLDSKTGEIVLASFQKLNEEEGHTIILITHDADVAKHASRIITLRDGLIVEDKMNHAKHILHKKQL